MLILRSFDLRVSDSSHGCWKCNQEISEIKLLILSMENEQMKNSSEGQAEEQLVLYLRMTFRLARAPKTFPVSVISSHKHGLL